MSTVTVVVWVSVLTTRHFARDGPGCMLAVISRHAIRPGDQGMARRGNGVFNPNTGGKPTPELVRRRMEARLPATPRSTTPDGTHASRFACAISSAISTPTRKPRKPGPNWPPANCGRHAKSTWGVCVRSLSTCAGCGTAAMRSDGVRLLRLQQRQIPALDLWLGPVLRSAGRRF